MGSKMCRAIQKRSQRQNLETEAMGTCINLHNFINFCDFQHEKRKRRCIFWAQKNRWQLNFRICVPIGLDVRETQERSWIESIGRFLCAVSSEQCRSHPLITRLFFSDQDQLGADGIPSLQTDYVLTVPKIGIHSSAEFWHQI